MKYFWRLVQKSDTWETYPVLEIKTYRDLYVLWVNAYAENLGSSFRLVGDDMFYPSIEMVEKDVYAEIYKPHQSLDHLNESQPGLDNYADTGLYLDIALRDDAMSTAIDCAFDDEVDNYIRVAVNHDMASAALELISGKRR